MEYRYRGARALVMLHERNMRKFLDTWKVAKATGVALPDTDDPSYESFDTLLQHVLSWSRRYMIWMCDKLSLPDPGIPPFPEGVEEGEAHCYLEEILRQWQMPLADVPEKQFYVPEYEAPWKTKYCIDAMLEHAVMHSIRHRFQLLELMENDRRRAAT
jgi:hypothetical protein